MWRTLRCPRCPRRARCSSPTGAAAVGGVLARAGELRPVLWRGGGALTSTPALASLQVTGSSRGSLNSLQMSLPFFQRRYHVSGEKLMKEYLSPASQGNGAPRRRSHASAAAVPRLRLGVVAAELRPSRLCSLPWMAWRADGAIPDGSACPRARVPPRAAEPVPISALLNGVGQGSCKGDDCKYAVVPAVEGTCDLPQTKARARGRRVAGQGPAPALLCSALHCRRPRRWPRPNACPPSWLLQIRLINEAAFALFLFSIGEPVLRLC